jgi:ferrochelatase
VEETLDGIAGEGVKELILQPIGFLCDHVEILFDVDILFKEYANKAGIFLRRPSSLNTSPYLVRAVADLAGRGLARLHGETQG